MKKISVEKTKQPWFVYMMQCADASLYTGITIDLERRMREHNDIRKGAKYTRARQPIVLAYTESAENRSAALKREAALKKLPRKEKLLLIHKESRQKDIL